MCVLSSLVAITTLLQVIDQKNDACFSVGAVLCLRVQTLTVPGFEVLARTLVSDSRQY